MEDFVLRVNPITEENVRWLGEKQNILLEERILELDDIAHDAAELCLSALEKGLTLFEAISLLADSLQGAPYSGLDVALAEHTRWLDAFSDRIKECDRAVFSALFLNELESRGVEIKEADFLSPSVPDESFVYVRNPLSDEAYDVFSQQFEDPRVRYVDSFKDCVSMVSEGASGYCLLPIEERGGTRLHVVNELLFKNDLKICSVTPVFGMTGDADLKYALVCRNFMIEDYEPGDDRYLELRAGCEDRNALTRLFNTASFFGMSVYRVDTTAFSTDCSQTMFSTAVLRDEGHSFIELLCYLALFGQDFTPVGIYKNLE